MTHVFPPHTLHPRACVNCRHGENLHPPRRSFACARCPCMLFEPVKGSLTAALSEGVYIKLGGKGRGPVA